MQSGKHQRRVNEPHSIAVDGYDLIWEKRHPILVDWRREVKGASVSVWIRPGKTKELILDVMFDVYGVETFPNPDRWEVILREAIRSALDEGWDPESRGTAYRHTPASA
jgi:hypothetical protein